MVISKFSVVKESKIDFPMTRERYLSTWKIFRSISDENYITARHVLSLDIWNDIESVLDLGCGDGLIMKSLVLNSPEQIEKVVLVDPDKEMLDEAVLHLSELGIVDEIQSEVAKFEDVLYKYIHSVDLILAVHLVYLVSPDVFKTLLNSLPIGKKLILILDDDSSVFTKLWRRLSPKYAERSSAARVYLQNIPDTYSVKKTTITSKIVNPLQQREDIKSSLLSLMSYADFDLMDSKSQNFVEETIQESVAGRFLDCTSACYEIKRVK
jgi:SAM-dependent methyltransferase